MTAYRKSKKSQENSRAVGLDIALKVVSFVTGKEHLHYGYWEGLDVNLENLGKAQEAYTQHLFKYLPKQKPNKRLKILDIGGGSGQIAKYLIDLGHQVTIVIPSSILAEHAKKNTEGKAEIQPTTFEEYTPKENIKFDLCLYAESFQYIPVKIALQKATQLLNKNGEILIVDCFRSAQEHTGIFRKPGGGPSLASMESEIKRQKLEIINKEEITKAVSPSIELEQQFYNTIGFSINRIIRSLKITRPIGLRFLNILYKLLLSKRKRLRLENRLFEKTRSKDLFLQYNHYMIFRLKPLQK
ncbi:MAG: class I SAM-dependent methyltransferase [Paracoccaceae bacterium]|nr:class I SAM-dependent methyltransferase [Paracoccaceae bacterium]